MLCTAFIKYWYTLQASIFNPSCHSNNLPWKRFVNSSYVLAIWYENSNIQRACGITIVFSVSIKTNKTWKGVSLGLVLKELKSMETFHFKSDLNTVQCAITMQPGFYISEVTIWN